MTPEQKSDIEAILSLVLNTTNQRKRRLAEIFLELVDKEQYPEYYEIIPEPRCLNGVKKNLAQGKYNDPLEAYEDLNLVFLNAMYYNEEGSTVNRDARTLKAMLDREWKARSNLPTPRSSPPPASAQKKHALATAPRAATPKQQDLTSPAAARTATPEMEIDVGGTPEPDTIPQETARDAESDEIVRKLERTLPRWEGLADVGWAEHLTPEKQAELVRVIVEYRDANDLRLASFLESLPEDSNKPEIAFTTPLSLSLIENNARNKGYESSEAFDRDMSNLFLKGRRSYEPTSVPYGHVLTLQRLYQALISSSPPDFPYHTTTYFSTLPAGPGRVKHLNSPDADGVPGVTTFRISMRDRTPMDTVQYKGWSIKLGDWLHLMNPDDPRRPIIGQVWKIWTSEEPAKRGQLGITVCWYYRQEQTFHPEDRQFWENEVFKTGHFAEHPVADIIEKIATQFTARHIRGRPAPPYWYPGWPLYVCDARYNDRERIFVKIKNWNSCVPEEVRKNEEFMPIEPFDRIVFPRRLSSPFVADPGEDLVKKLEALGSVPGGLGDAVEKGEGERVEGGGTGRKRPKRTTTSVTPAGATPVTVMNVAATGAGASTDRYGPSKGVYVGQTQPNQAATTATTTQLQATYPYSAQTQTQTTQTQYAYSQQQPQQYVTQHRVQDRSLITGAGLTGMNVEKERLPPETTRHFDRDPVTGEVLWFAAPPIDIPRPQAPKYSLTYLHYLAKKRKRCESMDVDEDEDGGRGFAEAKSATERLASLMSEFPDVAL